MIDIVDTNVLVRFFLADNPNQYNQIVQWFREAQQGKRELVISSTVVAEACYVLESVYQQPKEEIAITLGILIGQSWLKIPDRKVLLSLWKWYRQGEHFIDCFLLAWKEVNGGEILTFDKKVLKRAGQQ